MCIPRKAEWLVPGTLSILYNRQKRMSRQKLNFGGTFYEM